MQISRPQIITLRDALLDALGITQMDDVVTQLGQRRDDITLPSNREEMYREIVDYYNRQNRVHELIVVSRTKSPENPRLGRFAQGVGLAGAYLPAVENEEGLERLVRDYLPVPNALDFLTRGAAALRRVCLVSEGDKALGTGFLVGPGVVMTNHHVIEGFMGQSANRPRFTFDFVQEGGSGTAYESQPDWLLDYSDRVPDDTATLLDGPADAPEDKLDYAVVRLDGRPGEEAAGGAPRGWFTLPTEEYKFAAQKALLLYHHAKGKALQLSIDTDSYVAGNVRGTRVWHRSNTEGGSSGSPCFDLEWNPVALHQGYNRLRRPPSMQREPANRAVPLTAVRRLLQKRGKLAELQA